MSEKKKNIFIRIKDWFVNLLKGFWQSSLVVKIGIIFLIPPIVGIIDYFKHCIVSYERYFFTNNSLEGILYYGLMAIAGAYLIKGRHDKKE